MVFIGRCKADLAAIVEEMGCMAVRRDSSEGQTSKHEGRGREDEVGAGEQRGERWEGGGTGEPVVVPALVPAIASSAASIVHESVLKDGRFEVKRGGGGVSPFGPTLCSCGHCDDVC